MEDPSKVTPYKTKTGIQIGLFYEPKPYNNMSLDEELIQIALLEDTGYLRRERVKSIVYMVSVIVFILTLMLVTKN